MSKTKFGTCANCHKVFKVTKKQAQRMKQGKPVYCTEECIYEKRGKNRIIIHDIPCCKCGNLFKPTRAQYRSYKANNNVSKSYCSDDCRYAREYPFTECDNYVVVHVADSDILLDYDVFESYNRSFHIIHDKRNGKRTGYKSVEILREGRRQRLSRYILGVSDPNVEVDHINGNPLDNRRSNLRILSHGKNMWNKSEYKNNTSGIKGVNFKKDKGLWVARIQVGKDRIFLGSSKDKAVAEKLRLEAEKKYFGKYDRKFLK